MHDVEGPISDPGYPGVPGSGPPSFRANESAHYHRPLARTVNKNWLCFAGCVSVKVLGRRRWVAAASASLPMVCPSAIGKTFGLAAATRNLCSLCHDSVAHGRGCARAGFAGLCRVDGQTRSARGASGEQASSRQHRQTSLAAPPTARMFSQTRRDPRRWCSTRPPAGRTEIPGMR